MEHKSSIPLFALSLIAALSLLATGCTTENSGEVSPGSAAEPSAEPVARWDWAPAANPTLAASTTPRLISGKQSLVMSWLSVSSDEPSLTSATFQNGVWSEPNTLVRGKELLVNWADFPSVIPLSEGRVAAHWLSRDPRKSFAYGAQVRTPDGQTVALHSDDTSTEHGFVTLLPDGPDRLGAVWLDGRQFASDSPKMELRFRSWNAGRWADEQVLDGDVCTCCDTDAVTLPGSSEQEPDWVVAYRGHTVDEIRDIAITRRVGGIWTEPTRANNDDWRIAACPVNGPSLAATGDRIALAWYSGSSSSPGVKLAVSENRGERFGTPVRLDNGGDGQVVGRADVEWVGPDSIVVAWLERGEDPQDSTQLWLAHLNGSGQIQRKALFAASAKGREAGFPQLAVFDDALWVAWKTDQAEPGISVGTLPLTSFNREQNRSADFTGSVAPKTARLTATP